MDKIENSADDVKEKLDNLLCKAKNMFQDAPDGKAEILGDLAEI